jgi:hypothetical protein
MLPLVEIPDIVQHYAPFFTSVFSPQAFHQFQRYLSGLIVSEVNICLTHPLAISSGIPRHHCSMSMGGQDALATLDATSYPLEQRCITRTDLAASR